MQFVLLMNLSYSICSGEIGLDYAICQQKKGRDSGYTKEVDEAWINAKD